MNLSNREPLGGQPLVVCGLCEAVVSQESATKKNIETSTGRVSVWVCRTCMRLGSGEQARKYVMKEEKTVGG